MGPLTGVTKSKDRAGILHLRGSAGVCRSGNTARIRCNIDGPPTGADSRVAKPVFRLQVAPKMARGLLPVGSQRQDIKRSALQRRREKNMIPTRNTRRFRLVVFHARNTHGRPAKEIDALARLICKIKTSWNCEHCHQRADKRLMEV